MIVGKNTKTILWGKDSHNKWCWENWIPTYIRIKLNLYLTLYTKLNLKGIKDLNVTAKSIKLWNRNRGENLHDFGFNNDFLDMTSKTQVAKELKARTQRDLPTHVNYCFQYPKSRRNAHIHWKLDGWTKCGICIQ